jgi:hypothetical protein
MNMKKLQDLSGALRTLALTIDALVEEVDVNDSGARKPVYKDENGRLNADGLARLHQGVDAGELDSHIARELGISQPAVIHQKHKYLARKL